MPGRRRRRPGVDSTAGSDAAIEAARALANRTGAIVAVTGETDYVTDGASIVAIEGGDALMPLSTALGCALTAMRRGLRRGAAAVRGDGRRPGRLRRRRRRGRQPLPRSRPPAGRALRCPPCHGCGDARPPGEDRGRLMPERPVLDLSVYLVTDRALCGARGVVETVRQAIAAGATVVQLRDPVAKTRALVEEARALVAMLRPAGIPFIVNDRVDVAMAAGADGVHLGQSDMSVADARALMGPEPILGLSITAMADLDASDLGQVDYLGVGPVFATATKADAAPAMGLAGLSAVRAASRLPIVAIGGISAANAAATVAAGADGVAIVSAICAAPDAAAVTRDLAGIVAAAKRRPTAGAAQVFSR